METLEMPAINLNPENPNGEQGWYKSQVKVSVVGKGKTQYTIIENGIIKEENKQYTGELTISTLGRTVIQAWIVDEAGQSQSVENTKEIKIDSEAPTIEYTESSSKEKQGEWYISEVEVRVQGQDNHSRIRKYKYTINNRSNMDRQSNKRRYKNPRRRNNSNKSKNNRQRRKRIARKRNNNKKRHRKARKTNNKKNRQHKKHNNSRSNRNR